MVHLRTLIGSGSILVDGVDLGAVDYRIEVIKPDWSVTGFGTIKGDQEMLFNLRDRTDVWLKRENGDLVKILVTDPPIFSNIANIITDGPIPGF